VTPGVFSLPARAQRLDLRRLEARTTSLATAAQSDNQKQELANPRTIVNFTLRPIGRIRTPYRTLAECPRNVEPDGPLCELLVDPDYVAGLTGLTAGDHILLLYWFDGVDRHAPLQQRRGSGETRGVFDLRSPHRPNPIAVATVRIESIRGGVVEVRGMDCLDGTPLLDIKPALAGE